MTTLFLNRTDAGRQLSHGLPELDADSTVVLALPRGGVPVAAEICLARHLPLDLVLVRKISLPGYAELAVGAVTDGAKPHVTVNQDIAHHFGLTAEDIQGLAEHELPEIARRRRLYLDDRPPLEIKGKTVVLVDDGIATGASMRSALAFLSQSGAKRTIVSLPVAPSEVIKEFEAEGQEVICLLTPPYFGSVGAYYQDFTQVSDDQVTRIMADIAKDNAPSTAPVIEGN